MAIEYKTLDLRTRQLGQDVLIEALGPNGEWAESYAVMPDEGFREGIIKRLDGYSSGREESLEEIGHVLGKALFPDPIRQLYTAVLQRTHSRPNQGLKLRLHFLGSAKEYQSLPWESVRVNGRPIAMDPRQTIVRTVDLLEPAIPLAVERPPYRILVIVASPPGLPELQYEAEASEIQAALASLIERGLIEMFMHYNATLAQIESIVRQGDFHILHFIGHATMNEAGDGILVLVDDEGIVDHVDGRRLGDVLRGTGTRMAFLSSHATACGRDSGIGVAEALLEVGVPIAIGYNFGGVTDRMAIAFARAFYTELVRRNSPEQAMFAGRRALAELPHEYFPNAWVSPVLLTRTLNGRFWTGEAGVQIVTFIHEGRLVTQAKQQDEFDAATFASQLQVAKDGVKRILAPADQEKAKQLTAAAEDAINKSEPQEATQRLSEASTYIYLTLSNQEKQQNEERRQSRARWTVLGVSIGLLLTVAVLGYMLRDVWTPNMSIPIIALPISVLVWSFVGGVAAMLQAFVETRASEARPVSYEWLLWRPVVGVIMGSAAYLAIAAGLAVLGQDDLTSLADTRNPHLLWAVAFLGGFSDKFAILVFDNVVRTFSKSQDEPTSEGKAQEINQGSS